MHYYDYFKLKTKFKTHHLRVSFELVLKIQYSYTLKSFVLYKPFLSSFFNHIKLEKFKGQVPTVIESSKHKNLTIFANFNYIISN